jgi:hypothetical protein
VKRTTQDQDIAQVAGIIYDHIVGDAEGIWSDDAARKINDGDGWGYDVRYDWESYATDQSYTRVTGKCLSADDIETAIRMAHDQAGF